MRNSCMAFARCPFVLPQRKTRQLAVFILQGTHMNNTITRVDHSALKANQIIIIILNISAFVFDLPGLAAFVALVMISGTILGKSGFVFVYKGILIPLKLARPSIVQDNPEPHRFAQGLGGVFMLAASLALFNGAITLGWGLVWLVTALAALNAFGGFCVGCFVYYWLARIKVPGFNRQPPAGTFPGMKPRGLESHEF